MHNTQRRCRSRRQERCGIFNKTLNAGLSSLLSPSYSLWAPVTFFFSCTNQTHNVQEGKKKRKNKKTTDMSKAAWQAEVRQNPTSQRMFNQQRTTRHSAGILRYCCRTFAQRHSSLNWYRIWQCFDSQPIQSYSTTRDLKVFSGTFPCEASFADACVDSSTRGSALSITEGALYELKSRLTVRVFHSSGIWQNSADFRLRTLCFIEQRCARHPSSKQLGEVKQVRQDWWAELLF